jgi:hypothetical protein
LEPVQRFAGCLGIDTRRRRVTTGRMEIFHLFGQIDSIQRKQVTRVTGRTFHVMSRFERSGMK